MCAPRHIEALLIMNVALLVMFSEYIGSAQNTVGIPKGGQSREAPSATVKLLCNVVTHVYKAKKISRTKGWKRTYFAKLIHESSVGKKGAQVS